MQNLKGLSAFIMILLVTCSFSGCSYSSVDDDKLADDIAQEIINAVENRDIETLKSFYSDLALDKIENFNKNASDAMELIQGKMIGFNGKITQGTRRFGKDGYIYLCAKYDMETDESNYIIEFWYCAMNRKEPEKEGVQCVTIANKEGVLLSQKKYNQFIATHLKKDTMGIFLYEYEED